MTLSAGTRLGPYEVLSPLGAGGMGEVYKARDTRLDRSVAIKVLPERLSSNPDFKQRFEREAKAISQLSHPHICALYDVGSQAGVEYLVMELLEGQTLAERLEKGPLLTEQVLRFGVEIADALNKAHRAGIVHRDLKPGNVMLTKSGVKLLDFGLAKTIATSFLAGEKPMEAGRASMLPTEKAASKPLTEQGTILGTFQYMAPEQLEGKNVDGRTDIFALGAVLYEMASGRKAFRGSSRMSLVSSILRDDPAPISSVAPMTPPALDRLVRRCLEKDPDDRWQSAADVASELKWIAEASSQAGAPTVVSRQKNRERIAWTAALAGALAAIWLGIVSPSRPSTSIPSLRATIELPNGLWLTANLGAALALSPDGHNIAMAATSIEGSPKVYRRRIYVRALDSDAIRPLTNPGDAGSPFWSPDGGSIGFFEDNKLKRVELATGTVQTVCDAASGAEATWGPDGTIVFTQRDSGRLFGVPASGGVPLPAESELPKGVVHRAPHFLPGGRSVLFLGENGSGKAECGICVLDLTTRKIRSILKVASEGRYVAPGYLAFFLDGNLVVQPFDLRTSSLSGKAIPVAEKIELNSSRGTGNVGFAGPDLLVYAGNTALPAAQLTWFAPNGKKLSEVGEPAPITRLAIAPDARKAAIVTRAQGSVQISLVDLARGVRSPLTPPSLWAGNPAWSADSRRLAYNLADQGRSVIEIQDIEAGTAPEVVYDDPNFVSVSGWSPDGSMISCSTGTEHVNASVLPISGNRLPRPIVTSPAVSFEPIFSPDGRWLAYWSDDPTERSAVYVTAFPGPGGRWKVSSGSVFDSIQTSAFWWNGSNEIDYLSPDESVMAVDLKRNGNSMSVSAAHGIPGQVPLPNGACDYSPLLKRFLIAVPAGSPTSFITVITNWTAVLEKR